MCMCMCVVYTVYVYVLCISDRPGVRLKLGPGRNFLARAGGTDSGRSRGIFDQDLEPSRLAEVMKLFEN